MRRLIAWTAIATLALAFAGCGRSWSSWFYRGEACSTCDTTVPYVTGDYAPSIETLPGPVN